MIRKILFAGMLLFAALTAGAQNMKDLFINMPDSLSTFFTKTNREDFSDFLESNMKSQVKNRFDGTSEMKKLTKDYLLLQTTPQSTMEMKLLPENDSVKLLCIVETVCGPACDSRVRFFTTEWREVSVSQFFQLPTVEQFFQISDSTDMDKLADVRGKADMTLLKVSLSPESDNLSVDYTTVDYLDKNSANDMRLFLKKEPLVYTWADGKFILQ